MFEWADEKGRLMDSNGEVIISAWEGEKGVTAEIKSGYEKFVDEKTGYFDTDFQSVLEPKCLKGFQESLWNARAQGRGHVMIFTNKKVYEAFKKSVTMKLGKEFFDRNSFRIIVSTSQVIRIAPPEGAPPPPLDPPGGGPTP
jgi:hypothetical protein